MSVLGNSVTQQAFTPAVDVYSGNGSTVAFTLSRPVASVAQVEAFIENVPQSPVDAFTVNGNVITFTSAPPSGSSNIYVRYTSPITQVIMPSFGTVGQNQMTQGAPYWDVSGNVGIGTSSPSVNLEVKGGSAPNVKISSDSNVYTYLTMNAWALDRAQLRAEAANPGAGSGAGSGILSFWTAGNPTMTERMRIDGSGNLLVGTTSTSNAHILQTSGSGAYSLQAVQASASPYGINSRYSAAAPNNGSSEFLVCNDSSTLRMNVRSNGGIANYSANNVNLSDRREKTNFAPAKSYLDVICAIPVQTYNYIDQNLKEDDGLTLGVVAQDVQAVAPELVTESNWANEGEEPKMRLSIYQTDMQYALMKCIQEQQAIIEQLRADVDALKGAA